MAEMNFFVPKLGRVIHGRDSGSNKQSASKSCALSIIRQLFHLGIIEAFSGTLKKDKPSTEMTPYPIDISPDLSKQIDDCLFELGITPTEIKEEEDKVPVSLLSDQVIDDFLASKPQPAGVVPWSPPQPNWNPWTGCNIDEGPLATANLEELSERLLSEQRQRQLNDVSLQMSVKERSQLPVHPMKNTLMEAINENSVIIVRGNTGINEFLLWKFIDNNFIINRGKIVLLSDNEIQVT